MINSTLFSNCGELPPLPTYETHILPPLIPPIPDKLLILLLPIAAYWGLSLFFHWIDVNDYFPQYRLHTPAEVLKRNRVSRWEVVRDVVIQQVVQTIVGVLLGMTEPDDTYGQEVYDIAKWARRIRQSQRAIPWLLSLIGIDSKGLASNLTQSHPSLAGALKGGQYSLLEASFARSAEGSLGFAAWEMLLARITYSCVVPMLQYGLGMVVVDTWQYFLHRAMHMNKWMYSKHDFGRSCSNSVQADEFASDISLPSPPPIRTLRVWCALQSSV